MANITKFSPLREIERFSPFHELEEMWRNMRLRPMLGEAEAFGDIRVDVFEDKKAYTVKAEIPGVSRDDIKVSIDGSQVTVVAEVKKDEQERGRNMLRSERFYGQLYRSFTLDCAIDEAAAEAKYDGGVLELTLPKKAGAAAHQLVVH